MDSCQDLGRAGHVDIRVNVAGRGEPRYIWELERADFDRLLADNLGNACSWSDWITGECMDVNGGQYID
jgi:NAD(P)-dependent dehydrogenase (short-subunit alcohol dehydrogenase family)